jgi:hypothetical protein
MEKRLGNTGVVSNQLQFSHSVSRLINIHVSTTVRFQVYHPGQLPAKRTAHGFKMFHYY